MNAPASATTLGVEIQAARVAAGMTRARLGELAGISDNQVWMVETGRSVPRPENAAALAQALNQDALAWEAVARREARGRAAGGRGPVPPETLASIRAAWVRAADTTRSNLTARRVALGLTATQLAERAGVHVGRVCSLETGYASPRAECRGKWRPYAVAVADYLWTTCEELWPEHAPREPRLPRSASPPRPDELYDAAESTARITTAVAQLPARHAYVIACRFGLGDNEPQTLLEVGEGLGLSSERVRQLETEALARLAKTLGDLRP